MSDKFGLKIAIVGIVLIVVFGLGGAALSPSTENFFIDEDNYLDSDPYLIHLGKAQDAKECHEMTCQNDVINHYKMALEVNPEGREALDGILSGMVEMHNFDEALHYYQKLTMAYPERNFIETYLAVPMFLGLKQYESALSASDEYLERMENKKKEFSTEYALALKDKAKSLISLGRFDDAIRVVEESYELDSSVDTLMYKGIVLSKQNKHHQALEVFDMIKNNKENSSLFLLEKGIALWNVGKHDEATKTWKNTEPYDQKKHYGFIEDEILDAREKKDNLMNTAILK